MTVAKLCLLQEDADSYKAVIFNVDICDYYFIILKYNIISQRFSV